MFWWPVQGVTFATLPVVVACGIIKLLYRGFSSGWKRGLSNVKLLDLGKIENYEKAKVTFTPTDLIGNPLRCMFGMLMFLFRKR